jgi:AmmeMemoRadiSam system protein B
MKTAPSRVRPPAVTGIFYPARADALAAAVDEYVASAPTSEHGAPPEALVAPHAGYVYSGAVAGTAYASLARHRGLVERVVLLGPAHYVPVTGIATTSADAFLTPLGLVPIDDDARHAVLQVAGVHVDDRAHAPEHSLEVQLPFLIRVLGDVRILPLVVGLADSDTIVAALERVWTGPETVVVVSSDLSHYLSYDAARARDLHTANAIVSGDVEAIAPDDACGAHALRGFLRLAEARGLAARVLDLRSSGDTAGPRDRVVGYGAFAWSAQ